MSFFFNIFLAWYLENVLPQEYGVQRPWNFPFQASYWSGESAPVSGTETDLEMANNRGLQHGLVEEMDPRERLEEA